jgi:hypothetical protein
MASIGLKPMKDLWVSLIGFQSHENNAFSVAGGSLLAGYQVNEKLGLGTEFDYFMFDPDPADEAIFWSIGGWLTGSRSGRNTSTTRTGLASRASPWVAVPAAPFSHLTPRATFRALHSRSTTSRCQTSRFSRRFVSTTPPIKMASMACRTAS